MKNYFLIKYSDAMQLQEPLTEITKSTEVLFCKIINILRNDGYII